MIDDVPSPATDVLLDETARHVAATWLVPGGEAALVLGLVADHPASTIHWHPVDLLERSRAQPSPDTLRIDESGTMIAGVDAVVIAAPPDRALARRQLLVARDALRPGGQLYLAGANAEGVKSVIADAGHLFGPPLSGSYRSKQRFAVFRSGDVPSTAPSWATEAGIAPGTWEPFVLDLGDGAVPLVTQAGVFAGARVDAGTRLLLDALPERIGGRVLDAGCGAGIIGIAAARHGAVSVDMTDVNLLAVQAAKENVARLALPNVRVLAIDIYDAAGDARYDLIVSNPPFHRGKAVDFAMADRLIAEAPVHLTSGGSLLLVANAFLAYGKRMTRVFGQVETLIATRQFHVIRATDPR